jgi:hypothetical protein
MFYRQTIKLTMVSGGEHSYPLGGARLGVRELGGAVRRDGVDGLDGVSVTTVFPALPIVVRLPHPYIISKNKRCVVGDGALPDMGSFGKIINATSADREVVELEVGRGYVSLEGTSDISDT